MTRFGRRRALGALAAASLASLAPRHAFALTLNDARAQGLVGELPNGYIAARRDGPGVSALVDSVNRQRRQRYRQIASENNAPLAAVEQQAGRALIQRLPPGGWYLDSSSRWQQR